MSSSPRNLGKKLSAVLHCVWLELFLMFIFERERETECNWGGAEREGDRIRSRFQALTVSIEPGAGLELMDCEIMT